MNKPGYKTTEFWLSTVATLCGLLYASGVIAPDGTGTVEKVVALVVSVLASLGYTAARKAVKQSEADVEALRGK